MARAAMARPRPLPPVWLPPGYRAVFILHDIEGYEHEEIGRLLGCSTGTSKSQLHKARLKLRKLLSAHATIKTR
jgi:RNA polymerase sigma-70 factor (ECF subfamily)